MDQIVRVTDRHEYSVIGPALSCVFKSTAETLSMLNACCVIVCLMLENVKITVNLLIHCTMCIECLYFKGRVLYMLSPYVVLQGEWIGASQVGEETSCDSHREESEV